jgi:zinc D-Ala-D-Ala carboxypeptidase
MPTMLCPTCWGAQTMPGGDACTGCHGAGVVPDEQLSPHFALGELLRSSTAARLRLPNAPDPAQRANLSRLAVELLEPARGVIGAIHIDSGLRLPAVNSAVGGSPSSAHRLGLAADCVPLQLSRREATAAILGSGVAFDQLIFEATWLHLGLLSPRGEQRGQVLLAAGGGYVPYDPNDPRAAA